MTWVKKIEDYLLTKAVRHLGGQEELSIQIDLTNACNLKCSHCYHPHHYNQGAIKLEDWFEVLRQYGALNEKLKMKPNIIFCGGEPLVSPYLFPLLDRVKQVWGEVPCTILTNGTLLNQKRVEALSQYQVELQISIDGPDAKRHDGIRGSGNFEKALAGAELAKKYGIQSSILAVLSKKTSQWIPEFFEMAKSRNLNSMNFTRFIPQGAGEDLVKSGLDDSLYGLELREALKSIIDHSELTGVRTSTSQPLYHLIDPRLGQNGRFGFQGLVVDYKGNLKVSSRTSFVLGNVLTEGLEPLFLNHPLMKSLRAKEINGCGTCRYYAQCGGDRNISFATTGSFLEKDKGCWLEPVSITKGRMA